MSTKTPPPLACVLMASGFSRRFGGNKLLAEYRDRPLYAWAMDAIPAGVFAPVIVVARDPEVARTAEERGYTVVCKPEAIQNVSDTIREGLRTVTALRVFQKGRHKVCPYNRLRTLWSRCVGADSISARFLRQYRACDTPHKGTRTEIEGGAVIAGCCFMVCDQPLLTRQSVQELAAAFRREPQNIWALSDGHKKGNPVIFPAALFDELCALTHEERGNTVIKRHEKLLRLLDAQHSWELLDVDTLEDLEGLP